MPRDQLDADRDREQHRQEVPRVLDPHRSDRDRHLAPEHDRRQGWTAAWPRSHDQRHPEQDPDRGHRQVQVAKLPPFSETRQCWRVERGDDPLTRAEPSAEFLADAAQRIRQIGNRRLRKRRRLDPEGVGPELEEPPGLFDRSSPEIGIDGDECRPGDERRRRQHPPEPLLPSMHSVPTAQAPPGE